MLALLEIAGNLFLLVVQIVLELLAWRAGRDDD